MAEIWKTVAYAEDITSIVHGGTGESSAQAAIDALTDVAGGTNEHVLTKDTGSGNAIWKAAGSGIDAFTVKVDAAATAGYLGAASNDGVLRVDGSNITYTDGGDFVTQTTAQGIQITSTPTFAGLTVAAGGIGILTAEYVDEGGDVEACRLRLLNDNTVVTQFSSVTTDDSYINNGGGLAIGRGSAYSKLTVEGTITLKEQADAGEDTGGYGQIWVHDDDPNTLWFTDDDGTDVQLGVSGFESCSLTLFPYMRTAEIQGTWVIIQNSTFLHDISCSNSSHNDGDEINFEAYIPAGTYTVHLTGQRNTNRGLIDIYVGVNEVTSFDQYGVSNTDHWWTNTGVTIATSGVQTIRMVIDGKNGASSDYWMNIGSLSFFRTA